MGKTIHIRAPKNHIWYTGYIVRFSPVKVYSEYTESTVVASPNTSNVKNAVKNSKYHVFSVLYFSCILPVINVYFHKSRQIRADTRQVSCDIAQQRLANCLTDKYKPSNRF